MFTIKGNKMHLGIIKGTTTRHSTPVGFLYTHEVYLNKST